MQYYFPFSQVIGNLTQRTTRSINRHHYSSPWAVMRQEEKPQVARAVVSRPLSEIYY